MLKCTDAGVQDTPTLRTRTPRDKQVQSPKAPAVFVHHLILQSPLGWRSYRAPPSLNALNSLIPESKGDRMPVSPLFTQKALLYPRNTCGPALGPPVQLALLSWFLQASDFGPCHLQAWPVRQRWQGAWFPHLCLGFLKAVKEVRRGWSRHHLFSYSCVPRWFQGTGARTA